MRQCLYVSTAANLPDSSVDEILHTAEHNNLRDAITGFLLYNGRNFLQLVEGEAAALQNLIVRLAQDTRHHGMVIMLNEDIPKRACADWSMRQVNIAEDPAHRRQSLADQLPAALPTQVRQLVNNFAVLN